MMNTEESIVENDRIQLYFHLRYVNSPDIPAKNEYHNLVSPIVRKGGRFNDIHIPQINAANMIIDRAEKNTADFRFIKNAYTEAQMAHKTDGTAKYMNISQLIVS